MLLGMLNGSLEVVGVELPLAAAVGRTRGLSEALALLLTLRVGTFLTTVV